MTTWVPIRHYPVPDVPERTLTVTIPGPLRRADLPTLYERVCGLFTAHAGRLVHCDVAGVRVDAVTVEALAKLQLVARREGCRVVLVHASPGLRGIVALMGLTDVLPDQ